MKYTSYLAKDFKVGVGNYALSAKCPHCFQMVTFNEFSDGDCTWIEDRDDDSISVRVTIGYRYCPNPHCHGVVLFLAENSIFGSDKIDIYPELKQRMRSERIPQHIREDIDEAERCFEIGAYRAAALMIRRALESICHEVGSKGDTLFERLAGLRDRVMLPPALLDGAQQLKLLGNDAAHIEAQAFEKMGKEETSVALDVCNEIVKALYALDDIVDRLKSLRKKPDGT